MEVFTLLVELFILAVWTMYKMVFWAKKMRKGAFLFLTIFPVISIFLIPPPVYENIEKAKQEQRKHREDQGEPPGFYG